jgi:hypothetical protein
MLVLHMGTLSLSIRGIHSVKGRNADRLDPIKLSFWAWLTRAFSLETPTRKAATMPIGPQPEPLNRLEQNP